VFHSASEKIYKAISTFLNMVEKFYWADQVAENIIKQKGNKKEYVCASGITPSGHVHIGNFREVITTDLVVKALENKGKKVKFIYSWDDFDRFRKVPANIPKSYEKFIGMPISGFPSPFNKNQNYAEYFEKEFEESLKKVHIKPHFIRQTLMNKKCAYAELLKVALDKRKEIMKILNKYRKEPLAKDWYPLAIYCEKCKKDSTKIISKKDYEIEYECACGFKNTIDIRKRGIVSIKWRIDWPLRWKYEKVDFEPGGIDHSVEGGSFTTSKEISKKIFDFEPPIYQFYDWVKIKGGQVFSSSSGNALTLGDVEKVYEPEIIRYLFVGTKPKTGFQISFDNDVIKIYDEFDNLEEDYFQEKLNSQKKRIYELSKVKIPKKQPEKKNFRHLITLVQLNMLSDLNTESRLRADKVKHWLENYAPEEMKFKVQERLKFKFSGKEKNALIDLRERLKLRKFTEEELFNEFYNLCEKHKIKNTEFFRAAYQAIIGKEKGPRLSGFILLIGKDKIIKLLEQIK
jgi:lysyl-tRNA synthetase, class I